MNIEIKKYKSESMPQELIDLLNRKYGMHKNFDYFLSDYKTSFTFCVQNKEVQFEPFAFFVDGKMEAHVALIRNSHTEGRVAFFGFCEAPNDIEIFNLLWGELHTLAKKAEVDLIKGPINGSIWHQYRVVKESDGTDYFKSEIICEPYYYTLLKSKNPQSESNYYSAYRNNFDAILNVGKPSYDKLIDGEFSIRGGEDVNTSNLKNIILMSKKIFGKNWGYTELSEEDFFRLYSAEKIKSHLSRLYLLFKGEDAIGFCNILKENDSSFIFKTIGVLPEYQSMGFGNALAYKVHLDAKKEGIKKIIYALIKENNNIKNFPKDDAVIFRRYSAFEFQI